MKKFLQNIMILFVSVIFVGCSVQTNKADELKKEDMKIIIKATNGEVNLQKDPKKIVVLDYGVADTLRVLGYEDRIVGMPLQSLPKYLDNLGKKSSIQDVGNLKEVNLESIAKLSPDLIIASGRTQGQLNEFEKIAPTVYFAIDSENYWESVKYNVLELSKIFGVESVTKAEKELSQLENIILTAKKNNENSSKTTLMLLLNEGSLAGIGTKGRYGFVYSVLGFKPTTLEIKESARGGHGQVVSFESVLEVNPDNVFVIDRTLAVGGDRSTNSDVLNNELLLNTTAGKNNRIVTLTSDVWYLSGGGLESTRLMFEEIVKYVEK